MRTFNEALCFQRVEYKGRRYILSGSYLPKYDMCYAWEADDNWEAIYPSVGRHIPVDKCKKVYL